jgi:hypothetical protein
MSYIADKIKKYLGKSIEDSEISKEDLNKLIMCLESGNDLGEVHLSSLPICACNICRS